MTFVTKLLGDKDAQSESRKLSKKAAILAETMEESRKLLDVAGRQAEELLANVEILSNSVETQIQSQLYEAAKDVAEETRQSMNNIVKQHSELLKKLISSLHEQASKHIEVAQQELGRQITAAMEEARADIATKKQALEASLTEYETKQKEEIAKKISKTLPDVVRQAAGRSIPLVEHEQIVIDTLKKAEKEIDW